jgi:GTP-binding protein
VDELRALLLRTVPQRPTTGPEAVDLSDAPLADHKVYRPRVARDWAVERTEDDGFRVFGDGIMRLLSRHDLENEESLEYVESRLRKMGVIEALQAEGFQPGDDVEIAGVLFEFDPGA